MIIHLGLKARRKTRSPFQCPLKPRWRTEPDIWKQHNQTTHNQDHTRIPKENRAQEKRKQNQKRHEKNPHNKTRRKNRKPHPQTIWEK